MLSRKLILQALMESTAIAPPWVALALTKVELDTPTWNMALCSGWSSPLRYTTPPFPYAGPTLYPTKLELWMNSEMFDPLIANNLVCWPWKWLESMKIVTAARVLWTMHSVGSYWYPDAQLSINVTSLKWMMCLPFFMFRDTRPLQLNWLWIRVTFSKVKLKLISWLVWAKSTEMPAMFSEKTVSLIWRLESIILCIVNFTPSWLSLNLQFWM